MYYSVGLYYLIEIEEGYSLSIYHHLYSFLFT